MTAAEPVITVEARGEGAEAQEVLHLRDGGFNLELARLHGDAEVRVDHRVVRALLGHKTEHKFAELIRRHKAAGFISPLAVSPSEGDKRGGRPVVVFMLARWEIWYLIGKSQTPESNVIMAKLARAFDRVVAFLQTRAAREHSAAAALPGDLVAVRRQVADLQREVAMLQICVGGGVVGQAWVDEHLTPCIEAIVATRRRIPGARSEKSVRKSVVNRLRSRTEFTRLGARWRNFPRDPARVSALFVELDALASSARSDLSAALRMELARLESPGATRQLSIFDVLRGTSPR